VTAGAQVSNIDAQLAVAAGGTISGRVTSIVDGSAIEGVSVSVRDGAKLAEITRALTDAGGYYSALYIPTSEVKVDFLTDQLFLSHASEYYNDKLSFESADLVQATDGQLTTGIDAVLGQIPALAITTTSLPGGHQFTSYSAVLQAQGGRPFYYWTLAPGSDPLPAGLSLTGKGEIVGTPLAAGTYNLTIGVTDSTWPQKTAATSLTLSIGESGGTGYVINGYIWIDSAGGTPLPGVVLEGLPGPPATNLQGFYSTVVPAGFTGMARPGFAGYGFDPETDGYTNINVDRPRQDYLAYLVTLSVTTTSLPNGTTGQAYAQQLGATQGTPPYTWSVYSGTLPDGLMLASDGTISGTPLRTGNYEFTARVTDSGTPTQRVNRVLNVTIGPGSMVEAILYSSNAGGSFDMWAMNADGSNKHNLSTVSHDPGSIYTEYVGAWSPDGRKIAFASNKSGVTAIWIMDSDGRNDFKLTSSNHQELDCSWSPDGKKIYFSRNTVYTTDSGGCQPCWYLEIYVYDLQAGTETRLTDNLNREMCPVVSPDGTRIAYIKGESPSDCCNVTDIWIMNADGTGQMLLCGAPGLYDWGPVWGKTGTKIYFSRHNGSSDYDIWSINPDGTGLTRLTDNTVYDAVTAVSPDGSKILFKSNRNGQSDMWVMDTSGNVLGQLTNDGFEEYGGDWTAFGGPPRGDNVFDETFESSPVGTVPSGWSVANSGVSVAVSNARAQEGTQSFYMRASPYNGANVLRDIAGLGMTSGRCLFSFYMSADPNSWVGTDGYAIGHLEVQGYAYAMGIKKDAGVYKLCMYGVSEVNVEFPGSVGSWNRCDVVADLDAHTADFYFNGTYIGTHEVANYGSNNRVHLAAGASGPGGGCPTVYYDHVTIERLY
jgi:hypothetical protein